MEEPIPETWPPAENPVLEAPVFPLKDLWLFPYVVLPLHIFEPRYRQMIEDSLDGPGRIVIATVEEGSDENPMRDPTFYPVAGLGEIGRHERLEDGRFHIWVFGLGRVRIREVDSDRMYRRVEATALEEIEVPRERRKELREALMAAVLERTHGIATIPPEIPLTHLIDLLLMRMRPAGADMLAIYAEPDRERRAAAALEMHRALPVPPPAEDDDDDEP
ncbi:MAG: LON peptidase substrate-binding domain-containing protein [Planctomycetota bacterium]